MPGLGEVHHRRIVLGGGAGADEFADPLDEFAELVGVHRQTPESSGRRVGVVGNGFSLVGEWVVVDVVVMWAPIMLFLRVGTTFSSVLLRGGIDE